jgi:hypothetical protein
MESESTEIRLEKLAIGVANGLSIHRAAKNAEIADTTARRWAADPSFKPRVDRLRKEIIDQAIGKLSRLASKAANTLGKLLDESNYGELRLKAARAILQDLLAVREHAELTERLNAIEERITNSGKTSR